MHSQRAGDSADETMVDEYERCRREPEQLPGRKEVEIALPMNPLGGSGLSVKPKAPVASGAREAYGPTPTLPAGGLARSTCYFSSNGICNVLVGHQGG